MQDLDGPGSTTYSARLPGVTLGKSLSFPVPPFPGCSQREGEAEHSCWGPEGERMVILALTGCKHTTKPAVAWAKQKLMPQDELCSPHQHRGALLGPRLFPQCQVLLSSCSLCFLYSFCLVVLFHAGSSFRAALHMVGRAGGPRLQKGGEEATSPPLTPEAAAAARHDMTYRSLSCVCRSFSGSGKRWRWICWKQDTRASGDLWLLLS